MDMKRLGISCLLATIILIVFSILIYPTINYYTYFETNGHKYPVKINRLTGSSQMLSPDGWQEMKKN
jgi:hypothetical protein